MEKQCPQIVIKLKKETQKANRNGQQIFFFQVHIMVGLIPQHNLANICSNSEST